MKHRLAGDIGGPDLTLQAGTVKGRVARFRPQRRAVKHEGRVGVEDHEIGGGALAEPAGVEAEAATGLRGVRRRTVAGPWRAERPDDPVATDHGEPLQLAQVGGQRLALHANQLANSFMAFNTNYADAGLFGVHVSTDAKENLDDVAFCVMQEFRNLIYDPKVEDVTRAKQALKSSLRIVG